MFEDDLVRPNDVLLGRGKTTYAHPGNEVYRKAVKATCYEYHSQGEVGKDGIANAIIALVEGNGGRFLRPGEDGQNWVKCFRGTVRSKVKQALRDTARREANKSHKVFGSELAAKKTRASLMISQTGNTRQQESIGSSIEDSYASGTRMDGSSEGSCIQIHPETSSVRVFRQGDHERYVLQEVVDQMNRLLATPTCSLPDFSGALPCQFILQQTTMTPPVSLSTVMFAPPQYLSPMPNFTEASSMPPPSLEPLPFFKQEDVQQEYNASERSIGSLRTSVVGDDHQEHTPTAISCSDAEIRIGGAYAANITNDQHAELFPSPFLC